MKKIKFQYFNKGKYSKRATAEIGMEEFFDNIRSNKKLKNTCEKIAEFSTEGNKKLKDKLKGTLPFILPAVITDGKSRGYKNILRFTGIMPLDFDGIKNATSFRDYLIENYPFVLAAWLSASKKGVHAFVKIPVVDTVVRYKELFWGLANAYFIEYKEFDVAPSNAVLPMFFSPDPDIKINLNCETWTTIGRNPKEIKAPELSQPPPNIDTSTLDLYQRWTISNVTKAINKIVDNGHPAVRSAAVALGGRVSANYISLEKAEAVIHSLIESNNYLQKGIKGYQKTASEMLRYGMQYPLYFNN